MRKAFMVILLLALVKAGYGQQKQDTVIISLANTSKIIFTIQDRKDLEILKHYNFQELFQDVLTKLQRKDTTALAKDDTTSAAVITNDTIPNTNTNDNDDDDDVEEWTREEHEESNDDDNANDWNVYVGTRHWGRTWQSFNFDLGTNNYLANGKFPDTDNALYSVRPWGSWYLALNSVQRTRIGKKFFLEWGLGLSWYTFKFQNDNVLIVKDDDGIRFIEDTRDANFIKSKLSMSFLQASLVPVIDFGDNNQKPRIWNGFGDSFRIGIGPYVGYKISSRSKIVYNDEGREKDKNRDNFYLNNLRYGARVQIGYRSTDLFFNYDLNELFASGKGPKLNAFSFGVIF